MEEKFRAEKSKGFGIFLILILVLIIVLPFLLNNSFDKNEIIAKCLIIIPVFALVVWCWAITYYSIDNEVLIIKWGPFRWGIKISDINIIRLNQKTIAGIIKPTLSWKCIEIEYKKYKSISISPEDPERFVSLLKKSNQRIEIK